MAERKKIIYIISSVYYRYIAFEWIAEGINKDNFDLSFILLQNKPSYLENYFKKNNVRFQVINYYGSGKIEMLKTIYKIYKILKIEKPNIIHTHIFDANLLGLCAGKFARIKKRIYTRHTSTASFEYHPKVVKFEKIMNFFATDIVAVSRVVKDILIERFNVNQKKIHLIHHGFQVSEFNHVAESRIDNLKQKYKIPNNVFAIGVVSTFQDLKGIQYIIPAVKKFINENPHSILILANAKGKDYDFINQTLNDSLLPNQYVKIEFEEDIYALFKLFDVFIHVPININIEAFGQVYIEAMAAKIPSIVTMSGIACEIVKDGQNAIVVPYKDINSIYQALVLLQNNLQLRDEIILNAMQTAQEFELKKMIDNLERLYSK